MINHSHFYPENYKHNFDINIRAARVANEIWEGADERPLSSKRFVWRTRHHGFLEHLPDWNPNTRFGIFEKAFLPTLKWYSIIELANVETRDSFRRSIFDEEFENTTSECWQFGDARNHSVTVRLWLSQTQSVFGYENKNDIIECIKRKEIQIAPVRRYQPLVFFPFTWKFRVTLEHVLSQILEYKPSIVLIVSLRGAQFLSKHSLPLKIVSPILSKDNG